MKKQLTFMSVAILSAGLFFTSCKKESTTTDATDNATELQVQSDDQARFTSESDAADDDANTALENSGGSFLGESPLSPLLPFRCDATVTLDTLSSPRTITITYSGDTCIGGHRARSGSIVISFDQGFRWATAGAHYTITYNNLKITRTVNNKSIIINGSKTITNVSGGKLRNLATRVDPIVHTVVSDGMTITFDNGSQRSWKVAKKRTFTYDNGIVTAITGIAPSSVGTGVAEWGINRFNHEFKNAILSPLVVKQSCNFRLVSGQIQHTGFLVTSTTTFGLDAAGNPVICPNGNFYYKVVWVGRNGQTYTFIGPY
ncbi:MAG: hypothetical protein IPP72_00630 [Chitinophagaceae bacterium]|nr:hypothetical protein [Chitinophagaceae bacterium]